MQLVTSIGTPDASNKIDQNQLKNSLTRHGEANAWSKTTSNVLMQAMEELQCMAAGIASHPLACSRIRLRHTCRNAHFGLGRSGYKWFLGH
jgi:hypothetical protein